MKTLFRHIFVLVCLCNFIACNTHKKQDEKSFSPSDKKATQKTVELFSTLGSRMEKGIMLGHQDDLAYGNKWYGEAGRSDVKAVCGDYPAIFGWDMGNIEISSIYNTDSISFDKLDSYIKEVDKLGGISTLNWAVHNPSSEENSPIRENLVKRILTEKSFKNRYISYLDKLANFLINLKDSDGNQIPVVFQPFNEYNICGKNWWSKDKCTALEFKEMWIFTVEYLQNTKNIHHLIYSFSVQADLNSNDFINYYPGNKYVDIIGVGLNFNQEKDATGKIYMQTLNKSLANITQFASTNNKIAALTKTGMEGIKLPDYFSNYLYPIITQYKLSYIMFGKNSCSDENHYFIPIPGHPASDDFEHFSRSPKILTCSKI